MEITIQNLLPLTEQTVYKKVIGAVIAQFTWESQRQEERIRLYYSAQGEDAYGYTGTILPEKNGTNTLIIEHKTAGVRSSVLTVRRDVPTTSECIRLYSEEIARHIFTCVNITREKIREAEEAERRNATLQNMTDYMIASYPGQEIKET